MRKHFLILMLMALLPLAGWADAPVAGRAITSADFTLNAVVYGSANSVPVKSALGTTDGVTFSWDEKYYTTQACTGDGVTPKAVNTYYVKVVGTAPFTGEVVLPFEIQPATLTVTYDNGDPIEKIYGNNTNPAVDKTKITIAGWKYEEGTDANINVIKNSLAYQLVNSANKNANWTKPAGTDGGQWTNYVNAQNPGNGYALSWSSDEIANYTIELPENEMKITPIALSVANGTRFSYDTDKLDYDYTGTAHLPVYTIKYKNSQNVDETLVIKSGNANNDFSVSYTWCTTSNGDYSEDTHNNTWAGYYKAQITGHGNYYGTVNFPAKFKGTKAYYQIKKVPLVFYVDDKSKVYDGVAFNIADATYQGFGLVAADAAVDYSAAVEPSVVGETALNKNAGTWEIKVTVTNADLPDVIKNNYTINAANNVNGFWTINKRPVTVTPKAITDNYGAPLTNLSTLVLDKDNYDTYVTLQANGTNVGIAGAVDVDDPGVEPQVGNAVDNPGAAPDPNDNTLYPNGEEDQAYITALATWTEANAAYTAYQNAVAVHTAWEVANAAYTAALNAYNDEIEDILGGFSLAYAGEYTQAGTYANGILVQPKATTGENPYAGNYIITAGAPATYKINGRTVNLYPKVANLTYGQTVPANLEYGTAGLTGSMGEGTTIAFRITKMVEVNQVETEVNVTVPENGRLDAGNYFVYIDEANSNIVLPANYEHYTIQSNHAALTIAKKDIYAIPEAATLGLGNTVDDLNVIGHDNVRFLNNDNTNPTTGAYTGVNALEEGDVLSYMLVFNNGVTVSEAPATKGQITAIADGATIIAKEVLPVGEPAAVPDAEKDYYVAANANKNYTFHFVTAALTNGAGVLVLDRTAAGLRNQLTAAHNKTYTVRFKNERTLNAKKWYSMVLPFEISVAKLSNFLGYAIVNLLDETATDGNVHFSLTMDKIPANTPFLVKAVDDNKNVNLNYVAITNERQIASVKIIDPEADTKTVTSTGVEFTGVFKKDFVLATGDKFYAGDNDFYTVGSKSTSLNPFASFWRASSGARVFVEDLDENGTTVIKEINAQTMNEISADGWYTINGIKLNNIPTEKGIYIHNGKKVVLK